MEDKMNKEFDRSIEQMMNQHSVAPPFGAWNRIAVELPLVAPTAAPVAPRIPKSAWIGFLSGASLIATLVGGTLIYNNYSHQQEKNAFTNEVTAPRIEVIAPVEARKDAVVEVKTSKNSPVASKVKNNEPLTLAVVEDNIDTNQLLADNPTATTAIATAEKTEESYFFPAVDINTGKEEEAIVQYAMPSEYNNIAPHHSESDKKVKSNMVKEIRFKPRRDKKRPHNYGRTNRLK